MNFPLYSLVLRGKDTPWQAVKQRIRLWMKPDNHDLVLNAAMDLTRSTRELILENMLLRQQLIVLKRQVKRPALSWRDRTLFVLLASKLPTWKQALMIVQPDTVLRWHRDLFRWVWRRRSRPRRRGKPPLRDDIVSMIKQIACHLPMAEENRTWGGRAGSRRTAEAGVAGQQEHHSEVHR
jgi:putative transposase